jgi:hypothetical protein
LIEGFDGDLVRLNPLPMFVIYLVALCVGCLWIRNWLVYHASQVEAKLRDMGVVGVRAGVEEHHSAFAATVR